MSSHSTSIMRTLVEFEDVNWLSDVAVEVVHFEAFWWKLETSRKFPSTSVFIRLDFVSWNRLQMIAAELVVKYLLKNSANCHAELCQNIHCGVVIESTVKAFSANGRKRAKDRVENFSLNILNRNVHKCCIERQTSPIKRIDKKNMNLR